MTTYVEVSADRLISLFREVGAAVERRGGTYEEHVVGKERVFDVAAPNRPTVRVYSSLASGAGSARECGKDAVRIVIGVEMPEGWRSVWKPIRVFRTAPRKAADREGAFLKRLKQRMRDAWSTAMKVPRCPDCCAITALRDGPRGQFWGCLNYPRCRGTRSGGRT